MKKHAILSILFLLQSFFSFSQIRFEKGYFIKNSGERIECLIKNNDWKSNPYEFNYKLTEDSEIYEGNLKAVAEFSIYEYFKFKRFDIDIDKSRNENDNLSSEKAAKFKKELLFLKVLVEGTSNLFSFEGNNVKRFFIALMKIKWNN